MKRDVYIQTIRDYILQKPNRTNGEVREYAAELNATNEELETAVAQAQEIVKGRSSKTSAPPQPSPKKHRSLHLPSIHEIPTLGVQSVAIISLTGVIILGGLSLYLFTKINNISRELNSTHSEPSAFETSSIIGNLAPPVYANQQMPVDADAIFSYPASDITLTYSGTINREIFGFFPYWMIDKQDKINTAGFTDIAVFGLTTDGKGNIMTAAKGEPDPGWTMWNDPRLDDFISRTKKKNTNVVLVLKSFNNDDIESLVNSDENQTRFISNAVQLMNSKSLNGINIDFEYVGDPGIRTRDNFTRFISNLNAEMKRQNPDAKLTVDTYVSSAADDNFFDVQGLGDHVDAFVVMGYDVHTPNGDPGPVSPLEGSSGLNGYIQSYLERVNPDKIILALPYYGYDWPEKGEPGTSKILPYAIIAANSKNSKINWDKASQTPYYTYTDENGIGREVHFDNARSLGLKYDFINREDLKGVGIWALGYDGLNQELHQVLLDKFSK